MRTLHAVLLTGLLGLLAITTPASAQPVAATPRGIINTSLRGYVGPDEANVIGGLVIEGTSTRKVLIRAVGPSLGAFGIRSPLPDPRIVIHRADGSVYDLYYGYTAYAGSITPEQDLANATTAVGAFPLDPAAGDAVQLRPLLPGAYTIIVTSATGQTGTVLLEIYDVPTDVSLEP